MEVERRTVRFRAPPRRRRLRRGRAAATTAALVPVKTAAQVEDGGVAYLGCFVAVPPREGAGCFVLPPQQARRLPEQPPPQERTQGIM